MGQLTGSVQKIVDARRRCAKAVIQRGENAFTIIEPDKAGLKANKQRLMAVEICYEID